MENDDEVADSEDDEFVKPGEKQKARISNVQCIHTRRAPRAHMH